MRARRVVLCVDADEEQLSVRAFVLQTRGFTVLQALSAGEALRILKARAECETAVLITEFDLGEGMLDGNQLARHAAEMCPGIRRLITSRRAIRPEWTNAAEVFLPKGIGAAELVERVRILAARKRGPKKRPARKSPLSGWTSYSAAIPEQSAIAERVA